VDGKNHQKVKKEKNLHKEIEKSACRCCHHVDFFAFLWGIQRGDEHNFFCPDCGHMFNY